MSTDIKTDIPLEALKAIEERGVEILKEEILKSQDRLNKSFMKRLRKRFRLATFTHEDLVFLQTCYTRALKELSERGINANRLPKLSEDEGRGNI